MRHGLALYQLLVRLLPGDFRERHADEMMALLADQLEGRSPPRRMRLWAWACWDVLRTAVRMRVAMRRRRRTLDGSGGGAMDGLIQDLGFAVRALRRRPGLAVVAVAVLALGIGGVVTIYSVVHGVLLRPLPYEASERIGILWHDLGDGAQSLPALNPLDLYDYREWSETFEAFTLATGDEAILGGQDDAELVDVGRVEAGFFEFFGAEPLVGRSIIPQDDHPGAAPVALLSHRLWSRRFGADPEVIGRTVRLGTDQHQIVGVLPEGFRLHLPTEAFRLRDAEIWTAARVDEGDLPPRNFTGFTAFGQIRQGVDFRTAQADLDRMEERLKEAHAVHAASNLQVRVVPLHDDVVKGVRPTLVFLFASVALVLLVASLNVANLLLVRGHSRERELSVRAALGAGQRRVVRLVLLECVLLALVGGLVGIGLAYGGLAVVRGLGRGSLPRLDEVSVDPAVLLFAVAASLTAAVAAGIVPSLRAGRVQPARAIADGVRSGLSRSGARFRDGLILAEVAVTLVLLVGAGLMIRSFDALQHVDPGYATEGLLTFRLSLPESASPDYADEDVFYSVLEERLGGLPGVTGVSAVSLLPLAGSGPLQPYAYDAETASNWERVTADQRSVTPGFFRTVGATILAGREFTRADAASDARVIVVDDRLAERAFPGESAVGRRLQIESNDAPEEERYAEIVGVVSHLRLHDLGAPYLTQIYEPMAGDDDLSVVVRASVAPEGLEPAIRDVVRSMAAGVVVEEVRTMESLVSEALTPVRIVLVLMAFFAGLALLLASVGLYGVLAFDVRQHTRDIGIRMALGQAPSDVQRQVVRTGMRLVVIAVVVGSLIAVVAGRLASALLFGVDSFDPGTYLAVTAVLTVSAFLACAVPARRATRVDPATALHAE